MDLNKTLNEYLEELSSNSPTPGGGNVAALSGVLASALGIMVCNLTIGKKKYLEAESDIINFKNKLENFQNIFVELGARDNAAFEQVMEAFKMPKDTDKQKDIRLSQIDEATFDAAIVPSEVINNCKDVLPILISVAKKGNKNSVSDAGVALSLISTSAQSALLNVVINCSSLANKTIGNEFIKKYEIICEEIGIVVKDQIDRIKAEMIQ